MFYQNVLCRSPSLSGIVLHLYVYVYLSHRTIINRKTLLWHVRSLVLPLLLLLSTQRKICTQIGYLIFILYLSSGDYKKIFLDILFHVSFNHSINDIIFGIFLTDKGCLSLENTNKDTLKPC